LQLYAPKISIEFRYHAYFDVLLLWSIRVWARSRQIPYTHFSYSNYPNLKYLIPSSDGDCDYLKLVWVIWVIRFGTQTTRGTQNLLLSLYLSCVISLTLEIVILLLYNSLGLNKCIIYYSSQIVVEILHKLQMIFFVKIILKFCVVCHFL
jgi:hypothetical protein